MIEVTGEVGNGWRSRTLEAAIAFATCALFVWTTTWIHVDPLVRVGQVSGLAGLGLRFTLFAVAIAGTLVLVARLRPARFDRACQLACAAAAGLATAMIAGGCVVALHGTPWGIGGNDGDAGALNWWATQIQQGAAADTGIYPPLQIHLIVWAADLFDVPTAYAMKYVGIAGVAAFGPAAYLSWRMLLRPVPALAIGVVAALPLVEAYRPYPLLGLVVFLPLVIRFLQILRRAFERHVFELVKLGVAFALGLGVLFLLYSGWFQWSAPGIVIAGAIVFPWRNRPQHGAVLCGTALVVFGIVVANYVTDVMAAPALRDDFLYFDALVDPAYIAMWRGDQPGVFASPGVWPPLGELGGVGVFTMLLVVGFGGAIALGRGRTIVIGTVAIMIGAWLLRFHFARKMWSTGLVQLFPRTTPELLYALLILCGFAVLFAVVRARRTAAIDSPLRTPAGAIGVISALLLLFGTAGSAISDRYMPVNRDREPGRLTWVAHLTPRVGKTQTLGATAEASSSVEGEGWGKHLLLDGKPATGFSTDGNAANHEAWVDVVMPGPREFSRVVLHPVADGFPIDFTIEVWDGERWLTRVTRRDEPPPRGPQSYALGQLDATNRVRIRATRLSTSGSHHVLRLGEIELFP